MRRNLRLKIRDIAFLIAGIGIGSGVGLLLAPSNGKELRHAIGRGCRRTAKNINRQAEVLLDRAEGIVENAQHLRERGFKLMRRYRAA